jgi:RHS repeat-associated protein
VTGEEVTYQYDALNRLTAASTTDTAWGNAYTYDGWGNLTGKSVTKGTAPTYSQAYDPALNMPVGSNPPSHTAPYPYLEPYDIEDRTLYGKAEATPDGYGGMEQGRLRYEPSGRKLFWNKDGESGYPNPTERCEIYFYSITGQRLARYKCAYNQNEYEGPYHFGVWLVDRNQHIGGQLTSDGGKAVTTDRLGSTRAKDAERYTYFPYGEPRTATVSGGGLYAGLENPLRVYDAGSGRFNRPDPLGLGAVKLGDPGSWNRFAYVQGDPVNYADPLGLDRGSADDCTQMSETPCAASLDGGGDIFTNPSIGGWGLGTGFGPGAIAIPIGGVICVGSGVCEIVAVAAGGAAAGTVVWAGLRWIFSSSTDWKAGSFPTTEEIQKNCTPVGPPTKVPSTRRGNRDGGQSIEQEYICPDGSSYTIHTVTDNNGNIMDQHPRPGGPKYGPRPPGRLK